MFFVAAAIAQPLPDRIHARIQGFQGTVSLYAKNLDTGVAFGLSENNRVRTASTIKLPIMMAVFDAVARGDAKWTDTFTLTSAAKTGGTGILGSEISDGVQFPLRDLVHLMIVLSDNTATNLILDRFPPSTVNAYLDKIGIQTTRSLRKINDVKAKVPAGFERYGIGVSTPKDMVTMLEKLEQGDIVSRQASQEMLAIMKRCQDATGIRRHLGDTTVANKTGALDALRSDVGIVYSKGGRIAMAITVDNIPRIDYTPDNPGSLLISDVAQILIEGLTSTPPDEAPH